MSEAQRRALAWERHSTWIRGQFHKQPIFSPDESETTPLSAIYQKPRCFWHTIIENENTDGKASKRIKIAHVQKLHDALHSWLANDKGDAIRIVTGGPGSGKSSFARAFSCEAIEAGHRVVYVNLQRMSALEEDLYVSIGKHLTRIDNRFHWNGSEGFPGNPLDWRGDGESILLIFDGLDELSADDTKARDIAIRFLTLLERVTNIGNAPPRLRAIVLGRDASCEEAMRNANLPLATMLRVAPLDPLQRDDLMLPRQSREEVVDLFDPDKLIGVDQRPEYWRRWASIKGLDIEVPEAFSATELEDLTVEPLLLHLLIVSGYVGANWRDAASNRNLMYESILKKIHDRNVKKENSPVRGLSYDDFFLLMEALGLSAWQGNGRTGNDEEFVFTRDLIAGPNRFPDVDIANLKSVALQIHTREGEFGRGFEFIHKSFGEFLAARALINAAFTCASDLGPKGRKRREDVARDWCWVVGPGQLSSPIIVYLRNEISLISDQNKIRDAISKLTSLFNEFELTGFPVDVSVREGPASRSEAMSLRRLENLDRCAISALFAILTSLAENLSQRCSTSTETLSIRIDLTKELMERADQFFRKLLLTRDRALRRACNNVDFIGASLSYLNLEGVNLRNSRFTSTQAEATNFTSANLSNAEFLTADLRNCDFSVADLSGCSLDGSHVFFSDFIETDLQKTKWHNNRIWRSKFYGCDLEGSSFNESSIEGGSWDSVNAKNTHFLMGSFGANEFRNCDFENAIFSGVEFGRAVFFECKFKDASFDDISVTGIRSRLLPSMGKPGVAIFGSSLRDVSGLTQDLLNVMFGVREGVGVVDLPPGLDYPPHWYVNIPEQSDDAASFKRFEVAWLLWSQTELEEKSEST